LVTGTGGAGGGIEIAPKNVLAVGRILQVEGERAGGAGPIAFSAKPNIGAEIVGELFRESLLGEVNRFLLRLRSCEVDRRVAITAVVSQFDVQAQHTVSPRRLTKNELLTGQQTRCKASVPARSPPDCVRPPVL